MQQSETLTFFSHIVIFWSGIKLWNKNISREMKQGNPLEICSDLKLVKTEMCFDRMYIYRPNVRSMIEIILSIG